MGKRFSTIRHLNPSSPRHTACGLTSNGLSGVLQFRGENDGRAYQDQD